MSKLKLCVLFGGVSSEHEVSLLSAESVLTHLNEDKYEIHRIVITKDGKWLYYDRKNEEISRCSDFQALSLDRAVLSPDREDHGLLRFTKDGVVRIPIDVVFPVLHGKNGEDGTIQGLFELAGIPYVGSGVIGSSVCMDKCVAKILFARAGIPQANWVEIKAGEPDKVDEIEQKLGYPCFIKPSNAGSSVGISKAHNRSELVEGLKLAFAHDYKVLVEEMMTGTEVESSVFGNLRPVCADALGEIAPANEFYDYEAKYKSADSRLTIPAKLEPSVAEKLKEYALRAYQICECRGLSRVDFFVDKTSGDVRLNEINTLPGFTAISMYPKMWEASGVPYGELLDRLVQCALERQGNC